MRKENILERTKLNWAKLQGFTNDHDVRKKQLKEGKAQSIGISWQGKHL
jgi:hypothetical protein